MSIRVNFERLKDGKQVEATHTDLGQFNDWTLYKTQWEFRYGLTIVTEYPRADRDPGNAKDRLEFETQLLEQEHGLRFIGIAQ